MDDRGVTVQVRELSHAYRIGGDSLDALRDVNLTVEPGGYCAIQGPSGAGKTTLLSFIGGLDRPQRGTVVVGDTDVSALRGDDLAAYRSATVGFVFQDFGLIGSFTARENIELSPMLAGVPRRERTRRALELLDEVGLADRQGHRPAQLSGGERQGVAMARALANRPSLILADEPTGNLDDESGRRVFDVLESLQRARGCTLLVVTHDGRLAGRARQRIRMERGQVIEGAADSRDLA
jgi:putative ABC transport system ATP-binding protein